MGHCCPVDGDKAKSIAAPISVPLQNFRLRAFNCNNFNIRYWAGITAAAGMETCPQSLLVGGFKLYSFQFQQSPTFIYCHYLAVNRHWVISRLLPSLDVVAISQAPSPESNLIPRYPVKTMVVNPTIAKLIGQKFE